MRISDCSSDVCSSDLCEVTEAGGGRVDAFNRAFHLALLQAAGQPITVNFLERLHVLSERYVRKNLEPLGRDERDRKSVVWGKGVSVRVDLGGRHIIKKKQMNNLTMQLMISILK